MFIQSQANSAAAEIPNMHSTGRTPRDDADTHSLPASIHLLHNLKTKAFKIDFELVLVIVFTGNFGGLNLDYLVRRCGRGASVHECIKDVMRISTYVMSAHVDVNFWM